MHVHIKVYICLNDSQTMINPLCPIHEEILKTLLKRFASRRKSTNNSVFWLFFLQLLRPAQVKRNSSHQKSTQGLKGSLANGWPNETQTCVIITSPRKSYKKAQVNESRLPNYGDP